jgi:hypothetical protein
MCAAPFAVPVNGVFASETSNIPVPKQRPSVLEMERSRSKQQASSGLPDEERVCRSRLKRLGVRFSPVKRISGKGGCGIRYPIELSRLPGGVKLSGRTILNCSAGEALAKWTSESAAPAAKRIYGSKLVRIDQFASYACRSRNSKNGAKLSEHAKGSAVDLGRFILADGTTVEVGFPGPTALRRKRFLKKLRDAGCRFFTTVLGPGSDAYHKDHFHFDLAQRRRGYRYCR